MTCIAFFHLCSHLCFHLCYILMPSYKEGNRSCKSSCISDLPWDTEPGSVPLRHGRERCVFTWLILVWQQFDGAENTNSGSSEEKVQEGKKYRGNISDNFQASQGFAQTCLYSKFPSLTSLTAPFQHTTDVCQKQDCKHAPCCLLQEQSHLYVTGRAPTGALANVTVNCTASAQDNLLHRAFPRGVVHQVLFLKNLGQVIPAVALMTSMSYSRGEIGPLFFMSICHVPIKEKKNAKEDQGRKEKLLNQKITLGRD